MGDCDGSGEVTIDELLTDGQRRARPAAVCPPGDRSGDGTITIDEILSAVNAALQGCV